MTNLTPLQEFQYSTEPTPGHIRFLVHNAGLPYWRQLPVGIPDYPTFREACKRADASPPRYGDVFEDGLFFTQFISSRKNQFMRRVTHSDFQLHKACRYVKNADGTHTPRPLRPHTYCLALCSYIAWVALFADRRNPALAATALHLVATRPLKALYIPVLLQVLQSLVNEGSPPSHFALRVRHLDILEGLPWVQGGESCDEYSAYNAADYVREWGWPEYIERCLLLHDKGKA